MIASDAVRGYRIEYYYLYKLLFVTTGIVLSEALHNTERHTNTLRECPHVVCSLLSVPLTE